MEKLKSAVPETLKRMIGESTASDLPSTCSSLLHFLLHFQPFHHMVEDLAEPERGLCGKNKDEALQLKKKGNQCFLVGDCASALASYSQALRVAPMDADEMDKNLVATLYMNRASVLHKMNLLAECLRDCNRALQISPSYAKAWYRRGRANASLGNYEDAIHDLKVAKIVELSLSGKQQIESELKTILDGYNNIINSPAQHTEEKLNILDESHQIKLQCITTPDKARGMASKNDIPPASLIHTEEPFAAIILKQCRETHCHYCFNELPADKVPCTSCSIPLYCSKHCQLQAGGRTFQNNPKNHGIQENLSNNLDKHVAEVTLVADSETDTEHIPEHKHECQGVNWPAILPPEIVLAGRVLVKSILERGGSLDKANLRETVDLSHHYSTMPPESKLELHIYSIVLLSCLQHFNGFELQINGFSVEQVVILVSQIRVNSMTIVRMNSNEDHGLDQFGKFSSGALTSNVEQVKVAQAIYKTGSLFNHSCQPNIHAYFLSRTLFIRATEFVAAGCPLELSYGPQVGQWGCKDRIRFLEDEYSFRCHCCGCSELNLSDLVLNAFHCVKQNCSGIVLDSCVLNCEKQKIKHSPSIASTSRLEPHLKVDNFINDAIPYVAQDAFVNSLSSVNPGYCLKCGSYCDLESSSAAVSKAWKHIRRLRDALGSEDVFSTTLSDALKCLDMLRSTLHPYNKSIAEVEDSLAQAFCLVGDLPRAMDHCKASIEILEKLYNPNHVVIGYELVKLASIQLSSGESTAVDTINQVGEIFSRYYGSQADKIFPYLEFLRRRTQNFLCK